MKKYLVTTTYDNLQCYCDSKETARCHINEMIREDDTRSKKDFIVKIVYL